MNSEPKWHEDKSELANTFSIEKSCFFKVSKLWEVALSERSKRNGDGLIFLCGWLRTQWIDSINQSSFDKGRFGGDESVERQYPCEDC